MMDSRNTKQRASRSTFFASGRWAVYLFLFIVALTQLLPFELAISTSLKQPNDLSSYLIPSLSDLNWGNFTKAIVDGGILGSIGNSAIVTVCATVLVCLLGAAAAYPLARRVTRWNKVVSAGVLSLMMIPPLSILVPLCSLLVDIGGMNTYWGIILVLTAGNLPLAIFLYTSFIKAIPVSIDEAGTLDGANRLTIFVKLILPLLKPVTATVIILTGVGVWNDYAISSYVLTDPSKQTIAPRVAAFFASQTNNTGVGAAAALLAALPVIVAYLFLQRYFIAGMVAGAEK